MWEGVESSDADSCVLSHLGKRIRSDSFHLRRGTIVCTHDPSGCPSLRHDFFSDVKQRSPGGGTPKGRIATKSTDFSYVSATPEAAMKIQ